MDRKNFIISKKDLSDKGYCRLVKLSEDIFYTTGSYPFGTWGFNIDFNIMDRDLSIRFHNYLKESKLQSINLAFKYDKFNACFKNITKFIWYDKFIIDSVGYDSSNIKHQYSISLRIFDEGASFYEYLEVLKQVRSFFNENNIKALINNEYLSFRWDFKTIGRYLNGNLLPKHVTKSYFEVDLLLS